MNTSTNNVVANSTTTSKYNFLPKFNHHSNLNHNTVTNQSNQPQSRVVSNDLVDSIANSLSYNRTISSSSSILSTPSNNIRKFQQQRQQHQNQQNQTQKKHHHHNHSDKDEKHSNRISRNGQLIKNKLLNLHQSHKQLQPNPIQTQSTSQQPQQPTTQKSLHNAEYYTRTVIFPEVSSDEEDESNDNDETETEDFETFFKNSINSIPGYTKGELDVLINQQELTHEEEKKLLLEYKRKEMTKQERSYMKTSSLSIRRQLQVTQKKEILTKIFGNHNKLNNEYITNNSEFSSFNNNFNLQMVFNEDREEIFHLLEEDNDFKVSMEEFRETRRTDAKDRELNDESDEELNYLLKKIPINKK
ncbi:hypothetical protein KGF54_000903 [Candida jiufengensis]|uniref:uncharacterized protein n=1 Tax=Candida jiufengensis TaxID=497108 RepID=UPI00222589E6|nr:uncharacterized protein KGF54_000903 [Candida jiufengensis]KAI5956428.1 hypothetical protein KGF54_000903 [Candida jiufengensis]